ncbi:hypothetical protein ACTOS9_18460 [Bacillus subtilis]|uniref:YvkN n=1 Tax=Bacillus subtilis TaxID=1423 RepID=A0AAX3RPK3_BACIU|nr:hypothetical protein [Bacillus subtilis]MED3692387.1 hypothetical protein [Bacillus subtilis]OTQ87842.1 hypothetical protein BG30_03185 [Bacillus subtilis subsp. subtilis]WEY85776.1 hypothetical protein P5633_06345 [Bacillus subtilis]WEY97897.1 hypothetical protein P5641_09165 [Bacillus subtilis]
MEKDPSDYTVTQESVLKLIHEQKRMNREMIAELEQIHVPFPISHDIQYIKVLLDSSNTHIVQDLMSVSKQLCNCGKHIIHYN